MTGQGLKSRYVVTHIGFLRFFSLSTLFKKLNNNYLISPSKKLGRTN